MENVETGYAPIILFVYARPDHAEKSLNALAKNDLAKLVEESREILKVNGLESTIFEEILTKIEKSAN